MIHTGYLYGNIAPANYYAQGAPFGLGGILRVKLGKHWRVGGEGHVSRLNQMGNGSYLRYGWGGVLTDFYWPFGRFAPFVGLTVGGGVNTDFLMFEEGEKEWEPAKNAVYHSQSFCALDPFVGCEYHATKYFHLLVRVDWMSCLCKNSSTIPTGPKVYFGFIFCH